MEQELNNMSVKELPISTVVSCWCCLLNLCNTVNCLKFIITLCSLVLNGMYYAFSVSQCKYKICRTK